MKPDLECLPFPCSFYFFSLSPSVSFFLSGAVCICVWWGGGGGVLLWSGNRVRAFNHKLLGTSYTLFYSFLHLALASQPAISCCTNFTGNLKKNGTCSSKVFLCPNAAKSAGCSCLKCSNFIVSFFDRGHLYLSFVRHRSIRKARKVV